MPPALQAASASPVRAVNTPVPPFDPVLEWPLISLQADQLWGRAEGAGVKVAVVDTGIYAGQQDLADAVVESIDRVGNPENSTAEEAHGTEVAGLIAGRGSPADPRQVVGLAPQAALINIRVATQPDDVKPEQIAAGISLAVQAGAEIINVSLASRMEDSRLRKAVADAVDHGCLVVASAGDTGRQPEYPARYPGVLAVGAGGKNLLPLSRLNFYGTSAIYAPGADLYSTTATGPVGNLQGSDYATAFVSAAAALLLSADRTLTPQRAGQLLVKTAEPTGQSAAGDLDPLAALNQRPAPSPSPTRSPSPALRKRIVNGNSSVGTWIFPLLAVVILLVFAIAFRLYRGWAGDVPTSWDEPW